MGRSKGVAGLIAVTTVAISLVSVPSAFGVNSVVNSLGDTPDATTADLTCADAGGQCTLRAAMAEAFAHLEDDQITFSVTGTIDTACTLSNVNGGLTTITGPGADRLTIRRSSGSCSLFLLNGSGDLTISGVTVADGNTGGPGGAFSSGGSVNDLIIRQVAMTGNTAGAGSAVYSTGATTIDQSSISGGQAGNAAVMAAGGSLNISRSTITGNTAT